MKVETLSVRRDKAEKEYQSYKEALKTKKDQYLRDMKSVYGHMRHGKKVIDVFQVIPAAGLNKDGDPKLAICRSDSKEVYLHKEADGSCIFRASRWGTRKQDIILPKGSFDFPKMDDSYWPVRSDVKTILPIIPAKFIPRYGLHNYYTLWESENWQEIPRDPILLKRLTPNIFVTLVAWNLSDLEIAVLRGRL